MAIYSNLSIDQGTDFSSTITVEDSAGNSVDLTGYSAYGQIRKTYSSANAVSFIATVSDPGLGKVNIALDNATTNGMKAGRYVYDVEIQNGPNGHITRVLEGQVEVSPGVTRSI